MIKHKDKTMKKILIALLALGSFARADDDLRELTAAAKISAGQAVEIAEGDGKGQAVKLDTDLHRDNQLVYEVEVQRDGKEIDLTIDGNSGEVLLRKEETEHQRRPAVQLSLKEAIAKAEADGSKVLEIDLDQHDGRPVYEIKTFKDKTVRETHLDANGATP